MTEQEWLACTDARLLVAHAGQARIVSDRKLALCGCGCIYRIWELLDDVRSQQAVEIAEQVADGELPLTLRDAAANAALEARNQSFLDSSNLLARDAAFQLARGHVMPALQAAAWAVGALSGARQGSEKWRTAFSAENEQQRLLIRCVFGNPFRRVIAAPAWLTSTVVALARGIYEDRAFDRQVILADALQDAGCDDLNILAHCRSDGPHARGCWVVDLLLGKE